MKIIIEISKEDYDALKNGKVENDTPEDRLCNSIKTSYVLPRTYRIIKGWDCPYKHSVRDCDGDWFDKCTL